MLAEKGLRIQKAWVGMGSQTLLPKSAGDIRSRWVPSPVRHATHHRRAASLVDPGLALGVPDLAGPPGYRASPRPHWHPRLHHCAPESRRRPRASAPPRMCQPWLGPGTWAQRCFCRREEVRWCPEGGDPKYTSSPPPTPEGLGGPGSIELAGSRCPGSREGRVWSGWEAKSQCVASVPEF